MEGITDGIFKEVGKVVLIFAFLISAAVIGSVKIIHNVTKKAQEEYKSKVKLEPIRVELTVENNKVDTLYIYNLP